MPKKAKILYFITRSIIGGAQFHVLDLMKGLHNDYDIFLATGQEGVLTKEAQSLGIKVHLLPSLVRSINLVKDFHATQESITLIREIQPDIIHAHSSKAGIIGRIAGSICNVPTVFTAHGWGFSSGTPKLRRFITLLSEKFISPFSTKIICVSESDRQLALNKGIANQDLLTTIRYGISNNYTLAQLSLEPPSLIMLARFNEQKDQKTLLRAVANLNGTDMHVNFVGSGISLDSCKKLAESLNISEKVSFLGDRRDISELLAKSQIFVLSTHYEGLPISILEAMRAGLPVVASSVNGIPEEVDDFRTGILVVPNDAGSLASALKKLIDSPVLRQTMGQEGRQKFLREFTIERMLNQINSLYQDVLGDKKTESL